MVLGDQRQFVAVIRSKRDSSMMPESTTVSNASSTPAFTTRSSARLYRSTSARRSYLQTAARLERGFAGLFTPVSSFLSSLAQSAIMPEENSPGDDVIHVFLEQRRHDLFQLFDSA